MTIEPLPLRSRYLLWLNRLKFIVQLRRRGRFYVLVLSERHRRAVKFVRHGATVISLLLSFAVFQSAWVSFAIAAIVALVGMIATKSLFSYTSMYVYPVPDFDLIADKWLSTFFGYAILPGSEHEAPIMGITLEDEDYARNIHRLLLSWTLGEQVDRDRNLRVVVIASDNSYTLFMYPRATRAGATRFYRSVASKRRRVSPNDVQDRLGIMFILGKRFDLRPASSYLPSFRDRYNKGVPVIFRVTVAAPNGQSANVPGLDDFILYSLRIKDRSDLMPEELEYQLFRIFGD